MVYQECNTVAEVFHEVFDLVKWDRSHIETGEETDKVAYYFRAENKNYAQKGSLCPPSMPAAPSLFRDDKYIQNEHVIFNETIRCYPQEFPSSETTFERMTRMAHFGLPTRLFDVSSRLATAIVVSICNAFAAISIDPIARTFTKIGGAGMVLTFGSGTWTASTDSEWISIKPRTSADAGVSCVYAVSKNMSTNFK